jgi:hypothetical protein
MLRPCAFLPLPCLQPTIIANLKDPDVSIRRRALDLLFTMCDGGAAVEVVEELVRKSAWIVLLDALGIAHARLHKTPGSHCAGKRVVATRLWFWQVDAASNTSHFHQQPLR